MQLLHCLSFKHSEQLIQTGSNDTEKNNTHHNPVKLKYLASVDNQISKTGICCKKFTDDYTNQ